MKEYHMSLNTTVAKLMRYRLISLISLISLITLGLLFAGSAATAASPKTAPDDTWINVSGTVTEVNPDAFVLDYGQDTITVEMDDGDRDADAYKLVFGDKVNVSGKIDDDFFEKRTIEAASVYVENLNTTFYASTIDENDPPTVRMVSVITPVNVSETIIQGTITRIDDPEEFVLASGTREVRVETDAMPYNPLDDEGYQRLKVGDRVSVSGQMDVDFLEGREFVAESIITLSN